MRAGGILLPISSLPSNYGIGCFSKSAYEFVDILERAGQKYWQILPLCPTGYGDSPYQSFSTFAGNPYFIDLESLIAEGILTKEECDKVDFGDNPRYVDYEKMYLFRLSLLRKAYERSNICSNSEFLKYQEENSYWLNDYAVFMAVKERFGQRPWNEWAEDIKFRWNNAMDYYQRELYFDIEFQKYLQYTFFKQWKKLKNYANNKGIKIIGDIPIYVAFDSADAWANPKLFQFDSQNNPTRIAGCPPDGFSASGQLWGNPLYNWEYHKITGYEWWIKRIQYCAQLYDVIRIDHFRGFDKYYSIPYGEKNAVNGMWVDGPGIELFHTIKSKIPNLEIIAEDLGYVTDSVKKLVFDCGFPGMKVLEFAFDSREESDYLPHNYDKNCVVYTGTHDNETLAGWYQSISAEDKLLSQEYLNNKKTPKNEIHWDFIRLAHQSVASLCIIPIQDYLGYGNEARMNKPSTIGANWIWRLINGEITDKLIQKVKHITKLYGR